MWPVTVLPLARIGTVVSSPCNRSAVRTWRSISACSGCRTVVQAPSGQQISQLRRRDRHRAVGHARPQKPATLQSLREQAGALAVMPDHLQQIAAAPTKAKQMSAQRIAPQHLLHPQPPTPKPLPHTHLTAPPPYPHPPPPP